ncbi:MAG: dicarboxylate/amino acid:cation symporter [Halobacteriovoraceae bacterium]|nr:dicarboxylate/amino acid:cation symporter [Halobacteriovoraceae bacterium]
MTLKGKFGLTTMILISLIVGACFGTILNVLMSKLSTSVVLLEKDGLIEKAEFFKQVVLFINTYLIDGMFTVLGKVFINSIKMLVVPLVLISLVCGVTGIGDIKKLGRVGGKTLAFYMLTTGIAIALALFFAKLIGPGDGLTVNTGATAFASKEAPSFAQVLIQIIPENPFDSMVKGEMLQVIFFSLLLGMAIASLGKKADRILAIFHQANEVVMKMVTLVMLIAPFGIFCLIAKVFAVEGLSAMIPLGKYMLTVIFVLLVHLFLVYGGSLTLLGRVNFFTFLKKFYSTLLVAFSTASSNATIPVTMRTVNKRLGVSKGITSFTIPFGATINMDGTAIMQGVAVIFISQVYNHPLSFNDFLSVILTATLASVGTAGVPGVGLITLSMVLVQVNLPVDGIALIIGVDRLLDMARTAVNISGDACASIIIAQTEGEFNREIFNDPNAGEIEGEEVIDDLEEHFHESHDILEKEGELS